MISHCTPNHDPWQSWNGRALSQIHKIKYWNLNWVLSILDYLWLVFRICMYWKFECKVLPSKRFQDLAPLLVISSELEGKGRRREGIFGKRAVVKDLGPRSKVSLGYIRLGRVNKRWPRPMIRKDKLKTILF